MAGYLFKLSFRFAFYLLGIPLLFYGVLSQLVAFGFSPRNVVVWGLAVVFSNFVLLATKPFFWMVWKMRGSPEPETPPEFPAWMRWSLTVGGSLVGLLGGGTAVAVLVAFVTLGSWWPQENARLPIGTMSFRAHPSGDQDLYLMSFRPAEKGRGLGIQDVEIKGAQVQARIQRIQFRGTLAKILAPIGWKTLVYPGSVFTKNATGTGEASTLMGATGGSAQQVLEQLRKVPGVEFQEIQAKFSNLGKGKLRLVLGEDTLITKGNLTPLSGGRPVRRPPPSRPDEDFPDFDDPSDMADPKPSDSEAEPFPGFDADPPGPSGEDPGGFGSDPFPEQEDDALPEVRVDVGPPPDPEAVVGPPSSRDLARIYLGDPFEGLD